MQSEPERVVRRYVEQFNEGSSVDEMMAELEGVLDAEVEFVNPPQAIESGTRHGVDGFRTALENKRAGLGSEAVLEILELKSGVDEAFVRIQPHARGDLSGAEVSGPPYGVLWTFRDGRVVRYEWSWAPDELLAAIDAA